MNFPEGLRYSAEHEWVAVEGNRARVGEAVIGPECPEHGRVADAR